MCVVNVKAVYVRWLSQDRPLVKAVKEVSLAMVQGKGCWSRFKICLSGTHGTAQLVKALVTKPDLISATHRVEGKNWVKCVVPWHASVHTHTHTYTQMNGFLKGERVKETERHDLLRYRKKGWADILRWEMWMKRRYSCTLRKASLIPIVIVQKHEKFKWSFGNDAYL